MPLVLALNSTRWISMLGLQDASSPMWTFLIDTCLGILWCICLHSFLGELLSPDTMESKLIIFKWSSSIFADDRSKDVPWVAFCSDVEHEIFPVTEGYDVTLTYNLYHNKINPVPAVDVSISPFYKDLKTYLQIPHFLNGGGTLGFTCQHAYTFEEFDTEKDLSLSLKGSDRVIFLAAKSLGLRVNV